MEVVRLKTGLSGGAGRPWEACLERGEAFIYYRVTARGLGTVSATVPPGIDEFERWPKVVGTLRYQMGRSLVVWGVVDPKRTAYSVAQELGATVVYEISNGVETTAKTVRSKAALPTRMPIERTSRLAAMAV